MKRFTIAIVALLTFFPVLVRAGDREDLLTFIDKLCRFKDIDALKERLYAGNANYVVNGKPMGFKEYLDALDDERSMGRAGARSDTVHVDLGYSGPLAYAQFLTRFEARVGDEETKEVRMNLMVFWKEGEVWKLIAWHSAGSKED